MSGGEKAKTLTESELKTLMSDTVLDTLTKLGIDSAQPLETQKDMAHLRKHREAVEAVRKNAWVKGVGFLLLVGLGVIFKFLSGE